MTRINNSLIERNGSNGSMPHAVSTMKLGSGSAGLQTHMNFPDAGGTARSLTFLVVGNHPLVAEGLRSLVAQMEICGEALFASSTQQALKILHEKHIDLILLDVAEDLEMEALSAIREEDESIPAIVLSVSESARTVREAVNAGATGYIVETAPLDFLVHAINVALSGKRLALLPLDSVGAYGNDKSYSSGHVPEVVRRGYAKLTPQEEKVLALITDGMSNKEIARSLEIFEGTVKVHVKSILRKLNAKNRTVAALMAASINRETRDQAIEAAQFEKAS